MARPPILFHCQHSLGLGHLVRSLALAGALASASASSSCSAAGACPRDRGVPAGVEVVPLPPLGMGARRPARQPRPGPHGRAGRAPASRRRILARPRAVRARRRGRRAVPVRAAASSRRARAAARRPRAPRRRRCVVCSVRDILVASRRDQAATTSARAASANRSSTLVLVHADPALRAPRGVLPPADAAARAGALLGLRHRRRGAAPVPAPARTGRGSWCPRAAGWSATALLAPRPTPHRPCSPTRARPCASSPGRSCPTTRCARCAPRRAPTRARGACARSPTSSASSPPPTPRSASAATTRPWTSCARGIPALVVPFADGREDEQTRRARAPRSAGRAARRSPPRALDGRTLAADDPRRSARFRPADAGLALDGARDLGPGDRRGARRARRRPEAVPA